MKKRFKSLSWLGLMAIAFLLVLTFRSPAIAQTPRPYNQIQFPPLPEIKLPDYERYQLDNGMVVYLMEDHQLPLVGGTAIIRTGSRLEPAEKVGLAGITGLLMRTGGTQQHPPSELNELLEQRAAIIETSIGTTSGTASFNVLKEDLQPVFELFAQVVQQPAFDPQQFELAKTQQQGEIARRNDDPGDIASREFRKLIYGENSPYARTVEYTTLNNISREDIKSFYQTYVRPDQMILGIVGDFNSQEMKTLIKEKFGSWQAPKTPFKSVVPPASQNKNNGIFVVQQPQLSQSNILLGHLGGELNDPDYPALSVLNEVLSGFGGRLFNEVRSRQGLAYSVYGIWQANYDFPGMFVAGGQTRSEMTVPFVKALLTEIEKVRTTPITEEELADAKESILNSFVFKFENPSQTLSRLMTYEYYGYPKDFIFQYQKAVKNTTEEDILKVAQKYLQPQETVTLVVGNNEQINPPLKSLGAQIQTVDVAIKQPKS
ncbi:M16 family metallopeptidase [Gloeothece verrucosa]|uniref:Peptidase M16 domain protein n=1 Tax=Gloeothece verrucosa (strain PCC 7822) TaxID=497965 RepID=E0UAM7_GLOV7|nr:pitrilysin family protein [Gloeothece verrucosa]ADN13879.1 peptidase M16 domain protein [Gloeothece verrucosa PCC 7822]